jgi:HSP20 family protein
MTLPSLARPWSLIEHPVERDLLRSLWDEEFMPYRPGFMPPVDVFHDDETVTVRCELPGCRREDLDVRVEGDTLTISGRKQHVESRNYHQMETRCGEFQREIALGHNVDMGRMRASYKDGILAVTMPLREEVKPRSIDIEIE